MNMELNMHMESVSVIDYSDLCLGSKVSKFKQFWSILHGWDPKIKYIRPT